LRAAEFDPKIATSPRFIQQDITKTFEKIVQDQTRNIRKQKTHEQLNKPGSNSVKNRDSTDLLSPPRQAIYVNPNFMIQKGQLPKTQQSTKAKPVGQERLANALTNTTPLLTSLSTIGGGHAGSPAAQTSSFRKETALLTSKEISPQSQRQII
jgi:hypothetical protein